jgi:hypothetical protein
MTRRAQTAWSPVHVDANSHAVHAEGDEGGVRTRWHGAVMMPRPARENPRRARVR